MTTPAGTALTSGEVVVVDARQGMVPRLFLSYASADFASVDAVRTDLEADGLPCWMAPRDVPASADFAEVIPVAIRESVLIILFLSGAANASANVNREAHLAVANRLPILPVRLEAVTPAGALAYLLADAQWIDSFPRVEPSLSRIRQEVRRLLQMSGARVDRSRRRTGFQTVVAGAAGWLMVFVLMLLLLTWIQRVWFNLVPVARVPGLALQQAPLVILALAAIPSAALAVQFWFHRDLARILSLDVLIGLGAGLRIRSAVVAGLAAILIGAIWWAPPTVSIRLEGDAIGQYNAGFTRVMTAPGRNYVRQCRSHFVVSTRVGRLNPPGRYTLRIELSPYATRDGIEFGDVLVDSRLGLAHVQPIPDDQRKSGAAEVSVDIDLISGERALLLTAAHYRDAVPTNPKISASVALSDQLKVDAPTQIVPASVFCSE